MFRFLVFPSMQHAFTWAANDITIDVLVLLTTELLIWKGTLLSH